MADLANLVEQLSNLTVMEVPTSRSSSKKPGALKPSPVAA